MGQYCDSAARREGSDVDRSISRKTATGSVRATPGGRGNHEEFRGLVRGIERNVGGT